jgi:hypothetical protein
MSKLNTAKKSIVEGILSHPDVTLNEESGIAFKALDAKTNLLIRTVSSLVSENGFYKSGRALDNELLQSIHDVAESDPAFILKLAKYARKDLYLRTVPIVLMGEFAFSGKSANVPGAYHTISDTIKRADEITELLSYVMEQNNARNVYKGKVPIVIKKGVAEAFNKFDAYNFAKYSAKDKSVSLRDALFITHPRPKDETQESIFDKIANNTLEPADTWEVAISKNGSTKEAWESILPSMGFMAVLRNCRNFLQKRVDIDPVAKILSDPKQIRKSKQFPYRFLSAYKEIENEPGSTKLLGALSDAIEISVENIPEFKGKTFVTCDTSGSMDQNVSEKSKITLKEIGCLFGAMVNKKSNDAIASVFATDHVPVSLNPRDSLFTSMKKMFRTNTNGCGTEAWKVMEYLNNNKIFVDRIILFSDMQCYDTSGTRDLWGYNRGTRNFYEGLVKYRREINKDVFVYSFDLAHYGTLQIPQTDKHTCIAGGFSDKILNFIPMFEESNKNMLKKIEEIKI